VDNQPINILTPLISIFLHGSWLHIGGNMLFFWVFGNNVEDAMGPWRFLAFYLLCGLAAAAAHIATNPASPIPTVGASGAISGVLAAYLLLYPKARVRTWIPPIFLIRVPAWFMLILWFLEQVVSGIGELNQMRPDISGGVAVWAHVGGFLAGLALVHLFAQSDRVSQIRTTHADLLRGWRPGY
jgi:membrane associated rhomboid family serine protease